MLMLFISFYVGVSVVVFCAYQYTQKEMARSYDGIYNNTCTGVSTKTTNHRNDMASLFSVGC